MRYSQMRERLRCLSYLAGILFFASGCIPLIIGGGVLGGYMISNDSASGNVTSEYRALWDLCLEELKDMEAQIVEINESKGFIKTHISESELVVKINTVSPDTQWLKVSARKHLLPNPRLAQKIFFRIIEELE
ncbi:MAG: hypothetical protein JSW40_01290 [Candidatus Omnitrophota bacterium]|nr:MAG: hypothetical protein JSW40_01290 [Candidatus Omnitrophota bacterium]